MKLHRRSALFFLGVTANACLLSLGLGVPAFAGPDRPGALTPPVQTGGVTKPTPDTYPMKEEAPLALPTDRGAITTPTFTLSPERPYAQGRGWLRFYSYRSWALSGAAYHVVTSPSFGGISSVLFVADPSFHAKSLFVACHVTNDDVAADALIIGDTGTERIPPRTARWLKGTSVLWNTTPTRSTNLFVVFSFGGMASELMVMVPENVYAIGATPPDGSDGSNMNSAVDVRVEVARTPSKAAASVSCSMTNASDRAATFSGMTIAPHATRWLDMQSCGTVGQDDVFVLRDPNFWSSIAINECRVRMQASVATSPGSIGPAAGGGTPPLNPPGNTPPQPGPGATRPPGPPIRGR